MNIKPAVKSILHSIGGTPVVGLNRVLPEGCADVYVKLEYFNPTGSYKDRMALAIIEEAERRGDLKPGMTVLEYTGGSTGSSLAFVCAVKGYPVKLISSDAFSPEKLRMMKAFGAEVEIVPSEGGKITPDLLPRMRARALELAKEANVYFTNQFYNRDAITGYSTLGQELVDQVESSIDAFCAGVGTAGMLVGAGWAVRAVYPKARIVALEPASSAVISTGVAGTHHIEGVGVGFVPPMLDEQLYDEARGIDEAEAREMARRLAREEGIFAGISSGMNVVGAIQLAKELGAGHTVATVAVDTGLKYIGGDLYEE